MNVDERRRKSDFAPAQGMGLKDGDNSGVTGGGLCLPLTPCAPTKVVSPDPSLRLSSSLRNSAHENHQREAEFPKQREAAKQPKTAALPLPPHLSSPPCRPRAHSCSTRAASGRRHRTQPGRVNSGLYVCSLSSGRHQG